MQSPDRQQDVEAERLRLELRLAHLDGQEMAQNTFIGFSRYVWPEAIISSHHEIMADAFDRIAAGTLKRLIVNMPPRHRFRRNTPVLTTKGWKTIETVEKGDYVFAPNGDPVLVTGKSDIYHEKLYEVETTDGQVVECDGEHLWTCSFSTRGHPYFDASFKTLNTKELFAKGKPKRGGPYLPDWEAVKFPDANLPIDPWLLGVWLGDGASSTGSIGCSFADKEEMKARVEACGYEVTDNPKYQQFNVLGLLVQLRELGVLDNKHIPDCYFAASIAQREALLQGLIDTDGSVGRNGRVTFHQTDWCLCEQVQSLVCSLGVKCRITLRQTKDNHLVKNSKVSYRLNFRHPRAALLARKARRLGEHSKLSGRSLTVRETERFGDVQCIEVANADGLFLAGSGFVVSHNTKSEFASYLLPAYIMGRKPQTKIIQATHTGELAVRFGRKVRNLMDLDRYKEVFSGVALKADSKAAGRWDTDAGGEYFAVGVGGAMTGRGADMLIIDDPHSEQDAQSALALENAWEWYTSGPRTRLQPGGAIVIVMTRWGTKDLTARLLKAQSTNNADQWEVIEFPAVFDEGEENERALWPSFWKLEELRAVRASMSLQKWNAMYQQKPTADEGAILKREWWKLWEHDHLPDVEYIIQSYDTAYSKKETADYSVITTWGVFFPTEDSGPNIMLMDVRKGRWDFPDLKRQAKEQYDYWQPDNVLIEAKATGTTLQQELRRMGIPVTMYSPGGRRAGQDKVSRANSVAPILESGMVWATDDDWAQDLIEECAAFPNGDNDDQVDSTTQALTRFRAGNFISLHTDQDDEPRTEGLVPEYY